MRWWFHKCCTDLKIQTCRKDNGSDDGSGWPTSRPGERPVGAFDGRAARRLAIGSWIGWDRNSITFVFTMYRCLMGCDFIKVAYFTLCSFCNARCTLGHVPLFMATALSPAFYHSYKCNWWLFGPLSQGMRDPSSVRRWQAGNGPVSMTHCPARCFFVRPKLFMLVTDDQI